MGGCDGGGGSSGCSIGVGLGRVDELGELLIVDGVGKWMQTVESVG